MEVIPALDVRGGRCVRLLRGDYDHETVYSEDPVEVAREHARAGARRLHLVDLDAARGGGDNRALIEQVLRRSGLAVQVAGGIRTAVAAARWLAAGAQRVVMGTAAVTEPEVLEAAAAANPGQVLAALDLRQGRPAIKGWTEAEPVALDRLLAGWERLPLGGVVLTVVDRDGTLEGPDLEALLAARSLTRQPLTYSGGVGSLDDLRRLAGAGAAAVLLGRALYEGRIRLQEALALE